MTKLALHTPNQQPVTQPQTNSTPGEEQGEEKSPAAPFIPRPLHSTGSDAIISPFIEILISILLH